ncbi:hypothetical protein [Streptacidiphilus sp. P02-A3a]|uniref:hypothetical protein n=1 Tax=Streptacidiphilus sp. P02-A3a TaxID=2704468 RepID=UPI0015FD491A|nr:hypothetical protein [Streptacidiphilus sp. P02-A3a]QMU72517.1 hypothetical protein GXP74_33995 [Streptacidiphilus sp. P02-A3a]
MSRLDPLLQLVLPFLLVGAIVLLYRWAARAGHSFVPRAVRPGPPTEYGLLVPVAAPADNEEALRLTALLDRAGVRNTLVRTTQGPRIMVWRDQAHRARALLQ